ncbi:MAG: NTP transferase domain-containing protein [Casimicrobium sp.]
MSKLRVLVAAAGRGTRAGLPYPKTLFPIQGKAILIRIAELMAPYDAQMTIIVSPEGEAQIRRALADAGLVAHLVVQPAPSGMGDAVLQFEQSPAFDSAEHVLLVWGDIPFIQPSTVEAVVNAHLAHGNDFTFATRMVDSAYTLVARDVNGVVAGVVESRELGIKDPKAGEREIGLFAYRPKIVHEALRAEHADKLGKTTGEHGFLYVIGHLASAGRKVEALPVATELDLVSLNSLADVADFV